MTNKLRGYVLSSLIIISAFFILQNGSPTQVNFKYQEHFPPYSGNWVINDTIVISDKSLTLNGSIIIAENASLALDKVNIIFLLKTLDANNGTFNITILDGGALTVTSGSKISTDDPKHLSYIVASKNAKIIFSDSSFENLGYEKNHPGIRIEKGYAEITYCNFNVSYNSFATISVYNSLETTILNNIIHSKEGAGIYSQNCSNLMISNNQISTKNYGIIVEDFSDNQLSVIGNNIISDEDFGISVSSSPKGLNSVIPRIINNIIEKAQNKGIFVANFSKIHVTSNSVINVNTLGSSYGSIHLVRSNQSIISNNYISNSYDDGLVLEQVNNAVISFNKIIWVNISSDSATGINITSSNDIEVANNEISSVGGDGIFYSSIEGHDITFHSNIISNVNNRGLFIDGLTNGTISNNVLNNLRSHGFHIQNSTEIDVNSNSIDNSYSNAIFFNQSNNFNVTNNYIQRNLYTGLLLESCNFSNIQENQFLENLDGIRLDKSNSTTVNSNYIKNTYRHGLILNQSSYDNSIIKNIFFQNSYGILCKGIFNYIISNLFKHNNFGVVLHNYSENNSIYSNDFIDNVNQAIDFGTFNSWSLNSSNDYFGNYWSDYKGTDQVAPFDFGDTPYIIQSDSADFFPRMDINIPLIPPIINNPADLTFFENSTEILVLWSASTSLKPSKYIIFINENLVFSSSWDGSPIVFFIDKLPVGNYSITCIVVDFLQQSSNDTVVVTILPLPVSTTTSPITSTIFDKNPPSPNLINEIFFIFLSLLVAFLIMIILHKR